MLSNDFFKFNLEVYQEEKAENFEDKVIQKILKYGECPHTVGFLKKTTLLDGSKFTFEWFYNVFRDFPAILGCKDIDYVYSLPFHELLIRDFSKSQLAKELKSFISQNSIDPVSDFFIFVFRSVNTYMCCHNLRLVEDSDKPYLVFPLSMKPVENLTDVDIPNVSVRYYISRLETVMSILKQKTGNYFALSND